MALAYVPGDFLAPVRDDAADVPRHCAGLLSCTPERRSLVESHRQRQWLTHWKLQEAFDGIHGMAHTLALGKVGGGRALLEAYALECRRTVFIGDATHDAEVARALGASCILLATGHQSRSRLAEAHCPVFDTCEELLLALA